MCVCVCMCVYMCVDSWFTLRGEGALLLWSEQRMLLFTKPTFGCFTSNGSWLSASWEMLLNTNPFFRKLPVDAQIPHPQCAGAFPPPLGPKKNTNSQTSLQNKQLEESLNSEMPHWKMKHPVIYTSHSAPPLQDEPKEAAK